MDKNTPENQYIKAKIEALLNQQPLVRLMLINFRVYDDVMNYIPDVISILSKDERGREILDKLGIRVHAENPHTD